MSKKPSLEPEDHVEIDQASGTTIRTTVYKRGLLQTETSRYDNAFVSLSALAKKDPRKDFEDLLARARAILREAQLPTDEYNGEILLSSRLGRAPPKQLPASLRTSLLVRLR
jgi:hypothetical protein